MARGAGGKVTTINPGFVARIAGAIKGARDGWFGPGEPLAPQAPPEVRGRALDYPFAVNLSGKARSESGETGIDFATLRRLADPTEGGLDLLCLAVEKRKDQMEAQEWTIRARDEKGDGGQRAKDIKRALKKPDLVNTFAVWQRMLLHEMLVTDTACVYLAPSTKGYKIPQAMDGTTLKRMTGLDGRIPLPPQTAFQQNLKGLPAVDYTLDELVYAPRNLRVHRLYGMSPVEQVVMTVNIALRRQTSQLEYYTAGSVPDLLVGVPETWTPDQIGQFQGWWDSILGGNTEERRRARFIPGGMQPYPIRPEILKDLFDEWLARIISYAFNLSPQALVKETNRATAQTSKEAAQEEGLEPVKKWFKDVVDDIIEKGFDAPDLELAYTDEEIANPETKANVVSILSGKKPIFTVDEAREMYGKDPATPEQMDELSPPPPPPPMAVGPDGEPAPGAVPAKPPPPGTATATKLLKARRSLRPG